MYRCRSGDVGTLTALQVVDYLTEELDYVPWSAATTELSYVDQMLRRTAIYGNFQVSFGFKKTAKEKTE